MKKLEAVTGRIHDLSHILKAQQIKYNFLNKPKSYYKDFYVVQNENPVLFKEQIDVRRLPPYFVHRKIREALDKRMDQIRYEKERKFRTTLNDHVLYAIICDSNRLR